MLGSFKFSPYLSSVFHNSYTKSYELVEGLKTIPQKWIEDLKHVEYNELLSSSIGPLALFFGWKRKHKEEFAELASGIFSSSFVHGDPVGSITAIVVLAYRYENIKNKKELRDLKWGLIKGGVSVGIFSITIKAMGASLVSFLVGVCLAAAIRKIFGILRLYEYAKFLKNLRIKLPSLKKQVSRRDFLKLNIFTYKNAWINTHYRSCGTINCAVRYESMNTAIVIIGLAMLIFVIVFSLKRAKEKRKAWEAEREKIKEYGEKINEETRNKKWEYLKKNLTPKLN